MTNDNELDYINYNIRQAAAKQEAYTKKDVALMIGMPTQTFYDRLERPSMWRLDELKRASKRLRVSLSELMTER